MSLYQGAYGFTQLRLLVDVFEGWLGLLVLAVAAAGLVLRAPWLPRFALLSGAVALLALAAINPDAWIARHNLDRYAATGRVDWTYLRTLSDDAVPALATLPADQRRCALAGRTAASDGWWEWNLGRHRADRSLPGPSLTGPQLRRLCPDS
jgi:two-component system sensor histidine kinase BaeS